MLGKFRGPNKSRVSKTLTESALQNENNVLKPPRNLKFI